MKLKIISQIIILAGIIFFLGAGVLGFMYMTERESYRIEYYSSGSTDISYTVMLDSNHDYDVIVRFYDRADTDYESARVQGTVSIFVDGIEVDSGQLFDTDSSSEEGEYASASDAFSFEFAPATDVNLTINGELTEGDEWSVSIYQDVPAYLDDLVVYMLVLFVIGVVVLIVGAAMYNKAKRSK